MFPRNQARPHRYNPCFIDRDRRECAVAHLVIASGQAAVACRIAQEANDAYIAEMQFPELDAWAAQAGLTREELALIQPAYPFYAEPEFEMLIRTVGEFLRMLFLTGGVGLFALAANAFDIARGRRGRFGPLIGLAAGIGLMCVALLLGVMTARGNTLEATSQPVQVMSSRGWAASAAVYDGLPLHDWWRSRAPLLPFYSLGGFVVGAMLTGVSLWRLRRNDLAARFIHWQALNAALWLVACFAPWVTWQLGDWGGGSLSGWQISLLPVMGLASSIHAGTTFVGPGDLLFLLLTITDAAAGLGLWAYAFVNSLAVIQNRPFPIQRWRWLALGVGAVHLIATGVISGMGAGLAAWGWWTACAAAASSAALELTRAFSRRRCRAGRLFDNHSPRDDVPVGEAIEAVAWLSQRADLHAAHSPIHGMIADGVIEQERRDLIGETRLKALVQPGAGGEVRRDARLLE